MCILACLGNQLHDKFFFNVAVLGLCNLQSIFELVESNHDFDSLFILATVHEEVNRALHNVGIISFADSSGNILDHIGEVVLHGQVHGPALVATARIELHGLVHLALAFKVGRRLDHDGFRRNKRHGHHLLVKPMFLCQADRMVQPL